MKILYVNNQLKLGGAETVVHQLRRGFPDAQLAVAAGKTFPPNVLPLYPRLLARLHHSRWQAVVSKFAPRDAWTDRAFRRLANGPHDLIHIHNFHGKYASIESLSYLAKKKPLVWTFHALWGVTGGCDHPRTCPRYLAACGECPQLGRWPLGNHDDTAEQLNKKLRLLATLPLHIVAPSKWLAEIVRHSPVGKNWQVHQIPNAVDAIFENALSTKQLDTAKVRILIVNRNFKDVQKGFEMIRTALEAVAKSYSETSTLILAGENADWAADELRGWQCEVAGYVSEPAALAALHSHSDIFLFASPAENFPCVILEAMAAGSCVVATPTGGVVEQIQHNVSGLLADEISGPSLAETLSLALNDPTLRLRLGEAARSRVAAEYTERVFIQRHRSLYEKVVSSHHSAKP